MRLSSSASSPPRHPGSAGEAAPRRKRPSAGCSTKTGWRRRKLSDGIRLFAKDLTALREMVSKKLEAAADVTDTESRHCAGSAGDEQSETRIATHEALRVSLTQ